MSCCVVSVNVESSNTVDENALLFDTCNRYDDAPLEVLHLIVGEMERFVAPFAGDDNIDGGGAAIPVPLTATFCGVAPPPEIAIFPL